MNFPVEKVYYWPLKGLFAWALDTPSSFQY